MKPTIVTLTGPSCAGKTTLEKMLKERGFATAISTTTRPMRVKEVNGEAYYFTSKSEFKRCVTLERFVEVVEFNDNLYGLSVQEIERLSKLGQPITVVCEPIGQVQIAKYAKAHDWNLVSVFVTNPPQVIAERFMRRFQEDTFAMSDMDIRRTANTYASRMATMMTTERVWHEGIDDEYDFIIDFFDEGNDKSVADFVAREALALKESA